MVVLVQDLDDKAEKLIKDTSEIASSIAALSATFEERISTHATSTKTNRESATTIDINSPCRSLTGIHYPRERR